MSFESQFSNPNQPGMPNPIASGYIPGPNIINPPNPMIPTDLNYSIPGIRIKYIYSLNNQLILAILVSS